MDKREIVNQYVMYAKGYLAFLDEKEREVRSSMAQLRRRPPESAEPTEPAEPIEAHPPQPIPHDRLPEPEPTVRIERFARRETVREEKREPRYAGNKLKEE